MNCSDKNATITVNKKAHHISLCEVQWAVFVLNKNPFIG